jgi:hypothetical protein
VDKDFLYVGFAGTTGISCAAALFVETDCPEGIRAGLAVHYSLPSANGRPTRSELDEHHCLLDEAARTTHLALLECAGGPAQGVLRDQFTARTSPRNDIP